MVLWVDLHVDSKAIVPPACAKVICFSVKVVKGIVGFAIKFTHIPGFEIDVDRIISLFDTVTQNDTAAPKG